jgi:hypothetical protein
MNISLVPAGEDGGATSDHRPQDHERSRLAALCRELGPERFTGLLAQTTDDTDLAETITSLLDQLDAPDTSGA